MKLIDALLVSSAGPEIREILRLGPERVFTELLYVTLRRVAQEKAFCDVRACIAKLENGELAQDAVEVVFRCLEVSAVDWHSSFYELKDIPKLEPAETELEIDTDDCFRVVCRRIDVMSVKLEKLGVIPEKEEPNQPPEPMPPKRHGSS